MAWLFIHHYAGDIHQYMYMHQTTSCVYPEPWLLQTYRLKFVFEKTVAPQQKNVDVSKHLC